MAITTNYSWTTPDDSQAFKLGANAIRTLGSAIDTTTFSLGQGIKSYHRNTGAALNLTTATETGFMGGPSFTPIAGRLYEITVTAGYVQKLTGGGNITIRLRKDNVSGTVLDSVLFSGQTPGWIWPFTMTVIATSATLGTTAFVPFVTAQTNTNGLLIQNSATSTGAIIIKDIGPA
jgi:hypothetical protein